MSTLDRRTFLRRGAVMAGSAMVAAGPMQGLVARAALAQEGVQPRRGTGGYGPLRPTPEHDTGETLFWLPEGFHYRVIGASGTIMADGQPTPINHDGMASFDAGRGRIRMVRNHEVLPSDDPTQEAFSTDVLTPYDPQGPGGTTTMELTPHGRLLRSWTSLNGTTMNCAGGAMPWGSWISCEENVNGPDANTNFLGQTLDLNEPHGYIFEVPISRAPGGPNTSAPIRSAGRFNHEAVAWGHDGHLYLTEDNFDGPSGFYRYLPPRDPMQVGRLLDGGTLEVLVVEPDGRAPVLSSGSADLRGEIGAGTTFHTRWVTIPDPDPDIPQGASNTEASRAVALQGFERAAANFSRIEGCWYGEGKIFFNATTGGRAPDPPDDELRRGTGFGQVWSYDVARGLLTLLFESSGDDELNGPDNITFTPQGSLLICEDADDDNYLRGLTPDGGIFDFALNVIEGVNIFGDPNATSEWAGVNFNPNGNLVFANLQDVTLPSMTGDAVGITVAIWGPFRRGVL